MTVLVLHNHDVRYVLDPMKITSFQGSIEYNLTEVTFINYVNEIDEVLVDESSEEIEALIKSCLH